MSEAEHIELTVVDHVATLTLNRPERLNAMLPGMLPTYARLLRDADRDPQVRAIIVTGAGRGFCSGADISLLAQGHEVLAGFAVPVPVDETCLTALTIGTPVITAINGPAVGLGCVLALAADVRFAGPEASLSMAFPRLGLIAEYASAWLLPRLAGLTSAMEFLLSGRSVGADEAAAMGLVTRAVPDALAAAQEWARMIVESCSPRSLAAIKGQLLHASTQDLDAATAEAIALMGDSFTWPDLAEAMAARTERRAPRFPAYAPPS
jgi:enoyl-CoA hydratase/carnithine racemase